MHIDDLDHKELFELDNSAGETRFADQHGDKTDRGYFYRKICKAERLQ